MLRAVVFDLDETLIDSKESILFYFRALFDHVGLPFPEDKLETLFTCSVKDSFEQLIPDPQLRKKAWEFQDDFMLNAPSAPVSLKPFAREALEALHGRYKLALATNRGPTTHDVLAALDLTRFFDIVLTVVNAPEPKPSGKVLQHIISEFEITSDECIYVGDSEMDVATARNAQVPCIIVGERAGNGLGDYQIQDLSELEGVVKGL